MRTAFDGREQVIENFRARIAELRPELELLENGTMHTSERRDGGPWVDTTARDIERAKQNIAEYERCISYLERQQNA